MKKNVFLFLTVLMFLIGSVTSGFAFATNIDDLYENDYWEPTGGFDYGTSEYDYVANGTGDYIGTGSLGNYGDQTVLDFFIASGYDEIDQVAITFTNVNLMAGTWYVSDSNDSVNYINYIMVKGATSFSLHLYDPAASLGLWDIGYLDLAGGSGQPADMSFIRAYVSEGTPVPEPGMVILLGIGLLGLAFYNRKRLLN